LPRLATAAVIGAITVTALPAAAAAAPKLPAGHYTCTYYTYPIGVTFSNYMRVFAGKRYNADGSRKKKGKFVYRGNKIKFKSGPYKGVYYGKWETGSGTEKELHLYDPADDYHLQTCSRSE
jgi:hypothetical protein